MASRPPLRVLAPAAALALFQVVGTFGATSNQPDRRPVDALAILLVLVGPAALARRDRWPLVAVAASCAAAVVYVGLGYAYGPIFASVVVALVLAVQAGHRHATRILAGAAYLGFVVASRVDPRAEGGVAWGPLALVAGWLVVVLAVSELVRVRREQAAQGREAARAARGRRRDEERLRLAQELHDVLAHDISLIHVQASVALHLLDDQPDRARPALTTIKAASHDALGELRTALDVLRRGEEAPRSPTPRLAEVEALVDGVRAGGLDVHLDHQAPPPVLPAPVELAAYRIVQEALTNVTRHSGAGTVDVRIAYGEEVTVVVTDDGVGDATGVAEAGNGITGMRERAASVGGRVDVGAVAGGGFRVAAHLPVGAR